MSVAEAQSRGFGVWPREIGATISIYVLRRKRRPAGAAGAAVVNARLRAERARLMSKTTQTAPSKSTWFLNAFAEENSKLRKTIWLAG